MPVDKVYAKSVVKEQLQVFWLPVERSEILVIKTKHTCLESHVMVSLHHEKA